MPNAKVTAVNCLSEVGLEDLDNVSAIKGTNNRFGEHWTVIVKESGATTFRQLDVFSTAICQVSFLSATILSSMNGKLT